LEEQRAKREIVSVNNANKEYKIGVIDIPLFTVISKVRNIKKKSFQAPRVTFKN